MLLLKVLKLETLKFYDFYYPLYLEELFHYRSKSIDRICLLYTSDAADDTPCVDLGGRRIIKKKTNKRFREAVVKTKTFGI